METKGNNIMPLHTENLYFKPLFVIRMKNGHVYLFDTKSAGSDVTAPEKHNALLQYIQEHSTKDTPLYGGVIIQDGSNWLYSKLPIENTTDLLNWDAFYPENA